MLIQQSTSRVSWSPALYVVLDSLAAVWTNYLYSQTSDLCHLTFAIYLGGQGGKTSACLRAK